MPLGGKEISSLYLTINNLLFGRLVCRFHGPQVSTLFSSIRNIFHWGEATGVFYSKLCKVKNSWKMHFWPPSILIYLKADTALLNLNSGVQLPINWTFESSNMRKITIFCSFKLGRINFFRSQNLIRFWILTFSYKPSCVFKRQ